jgi:hypothetical protein
MEYVVMADDKKKTNGQDDAGVNEPGRPVAPTVNWNDSEMNTNYCNVVNAASTREEVTVFFGSNQTWNPGANKEFDVKLLQRIILNPHAAKRLFVLLGAVLAQYEKRFGKLEVEAVTAAAKEIRDIKAK